MANVIRKIPLENLTPHPDNPNRMSKSNFAKLVRNIERTGRYEPLVVRRTSDKISIFKQKTTNTRRTTGKTAISGKKPAKIRRTTDINARFQIINGEHRWLALKELGQKTADVVIWNIDDEQTDILLATLNRLSGRDVLDKKIALLKRLNDKTQPKELAKLLPQTKKQIEKLIELNSKRVSLVRRKLSEGGSFANPLVFFVSDSQKKVIEDAIENVIHCHSERSEESGSRRDDKGKTIKSIRNTKQTKAEKRADALTSICLYYMEKDI